MILDKDGVVDYDDSSISQNSRVSYPIHHIENSVKPSLGLNPKNIFFLTADAFGVLPPISKLDNVSGSNGLPVSGKSGLLI